MKKLSLVAVIIVSVVVPFFAEEGTAKTFKLSDIVGEPYLSQLQKNGSIRYIHVEGDTELKLLPKSKYGEQAQQNRVIKENGNLGFVTECLYLINKTTFVEKSTSGKESVDTSMDAVSRVLRSISKMQGMKYFSRSRKRWDVLYNKTYLYKSADDETPIPDQNTGNADGLELYCYQHDHTFGGCRYRLDYQQSEYEMSAAFTNVSWMMYKIIKAVKPGQFKVNIIVMDCGDSYLMYMSTDADCVRFPLITSRLNDSFDARLDALYAWFISQF